MVSIDVLDHQDLGMTSTNEHREERKFKFGFCQSSSEGMRLLRAYGRKGEKKKEVSNLNSEITKG